MGKIFITIKTLSATAKGFIMKKIGLVLSFSALTYAGFSQQHAVFKNPHERFEMAKEYFQKGQYNLAYPILKELQQTLKETDRVNNATMAQEIDYYVTVSALQQNQDKAEYDALQYITTSKNNARVQMMNFHLAEYRFRKQQFAEAVTLYEAANIANLNNREIADMKFHQGYSYFNLKQFAQAKPLLNSIRQMKDDPNYMDANYYYGFIAFRDRNYTEALESFKVVENQPLYEDIVPYYIAQIYYVQGRKEEAVKYAEAKILQGKAKQYELELKQLLGHAYFERKEYAKAAPYLETYVAKAEKVRREDLYELSYSYYQANNYTKAIEGFKQLSGKED